MNIPLWRDLDDQESENLCGGLTLSGQYNQQSDKGVVKISDSSTVKVPGWADVVYTAEGTTLVLGVPGNGNSPVVKGSITFTTV